MSDEADSPFKRHKKRADRVWRERADWDSVIQEAYDFAMPHRRTTGRGKAVKPRRMLFDMTAPSAINHGAGKLVRQLFGNDPFYIEAGPLIKSRVPRNEVIAFERQLEMTANNTKPFFTAGRFFTEMHTTAQDLFIGTGAIAPLRGPSIEQPVVFLNIPFEHLAIGYNMLGIDDFITWQQSFSYEEIYRRFPNGRYSSDLREKIAKKGDDETRLYQDFIEVPGVGWKFVAYCENSDDFIVEGFSLAKPVATPRFYRSPGSNYGHGPLLTSLASIRVLNKSQQLALEGAAIAMLGVWAYRAGGTFNPDTVRLAPGEFWPMQSTGGLLGPDVQRLDPGQSRLDIARMVTGGMQQQVRDALLDTRLTDDGGTPASASEIAARLRQSADVHVGAYGRIIEELMPVIVPRTMEILNDWGILQAPLPINQLIYSIGVKSPMMLAMQAEKLQAAANYYDLVAGMVGPENAALHVNLDRMLDIVREGLQVPATVQPTERERQQFLADRQKQQAAAAAAQFADRAAPQLVQLAGGQQARAA